MNFPLPKNEIERLAALHKLRILDTEITPEFDSVVDMAAAIFEAPTALISFVDKDRQWFKARHGFKDSQTSRDLAFCTYTILGDEVFEVEDARLDERFRDNPLVTGNPHIGYYVGMPISLDGKTNVGTLCVIDSKPRKATEAQLVQLEKLRNVVAGLISAHVASIEARIAERNARQRGKLLSQVERISKIGAWSLDTQRLITKWSPQVFAIHELDGNAPPDLEGAISFYPEYEREGLVEKINACIESGIPYQCETDFITAKGNKRRVRSSGEIEYGDDGVKFLIGIVKDVTEQYEHDQMLWRAAHLDSLTGIANRRSFHEEVKQRINAQAGENDQLSLLMIDLDNFKDINDSIGHLAGDEVLRTIARRIEQATPHTGFCARLGGDEFAVLLTTKNHGKAAERLATKMVAAINLPIKHEQHEIRVGASIGIASHECRTASEDDLLLKTDLALYHVKQNGRGKAKAYEPAISNTLEQKRLSIRLVRSAISEQRLEPFYQPIIDLQTRQLSSVEALARVRNVDGTISGPADFWQALLEPQSAHEIDQVMLDLALKDFAQWKRDGLGIDFVSVNASSSCIQSETYVDQVLNGVAAYGLSPRDLKIEVVESVFLGSDSVDVRDVLERLSREGIRIALDDFGTGFASLSHLRDYPIDCIKIDKSFVLGLGQDGSNTAIVQALMGLGRSMNIEVISEGIETEGQLDFVTALGSQFGQGYFFSKPLDAQNFIQFVAQFAPPQARDAGLDAKR
ncbi:EAL domain-containing protein [Hoeflea sp. AS60]|uniref:sensor domain-containing phosphodiesterase n=1 Tax=Hoeflea sp. AS60 TaxID=3135780 RepID=UPI00317E6028